MKNGAGHEPVVAPRIAVVIWRGRAPGRSRGAFKNYAITGSFSPVGFSFVHSLDRTSIKASTPNRTRIGRNETIVFALEMDTRAAFTVISVRACNRTAIHMLPVFSTA